MAKPSGQQIIYISSQISAALLENAAHEDHDAALRQAIRRWLPDRDAVDDHMLKGIAATVRENLMIHRALLLNRLDRLVEQGKADGL